MSIQFTNGSIFISPAALNSLSADAIARLLYASSRPVMATPVTVDPRELANWGTLSEPSRKRAAPQAEDAPTKRARAEPAAPRTVLGTATAPLPVTHQNARCTMLYVVHDGKKYAYITSALSHYNVRIPATVETVDIWVRYKSNYGPMVTRCRKFVTEETLDSIIEQQLPMFTMDACCEIKNGFGDETIEVADETPAAEVVPEHTIPYGSRTIYTVMFDGVRYITPLPMLRSVMYGLAREVTCTIHHFRLRNSRRLNEIMTVTQSDLEQLARDGRLRPDAYALLQQHIGAPVADEIEVASDLMALNEPAAN